MTFSLKNSSKILFLYAEKSVENLKFLYLTIQYFKQTNGNSSIIFLRIKF